jgi:hypothetical protein
MARSAAQPDDGLLAIGSGALKSAQKMRASARRKLPVRRDAAECLLWSEQMETQSFQSPISGLKCWRTQPVNIARNGFTESTGARFGSRRLLRVSSRKLREEQQMVPFAEQRRGAPAQALQLFSGGLRPFAFSSVNSIRNFASNRVQADGDCNVQGMINFREYEPCVLSTYFVAGTDNSHDCLSNPSMKLVRLIFSPAEMKERRPALPVD